MPGEKDYRWEMLELLRLLVVTYGAEWPEHLRRRVERARERADKVRSAETLALEDYL